jgi:hypothetical protein
MFDREHSANRRSSEHYCHKSLGDERFRSYNEKTSIRDPFSLFVKRHFDRVLLVAAVRSFKKV